MDLKLNLRDSLSRRDITIEPREDSSLRLYACGPTVYNFQHIGNFRKFLFDDLLVRTLTMLGYDVNHVMNITDVGHLTGDDADGGADKFEATSRKENLAVEEVIAKYTTIFDEDWRALRLVTPTHRPRASHYVAKQIEIVQILIDKGHAYDTPEAVYYDVSSFPHYGALTGQDMAARMVGARDEVVTENSKRNPADFALWFKRVGAHARAIQYWPSPWGDGFPGRHLECSALAAEFLGEHIDIHTGGVDHLFPHHTNEIAQSEGAFGAPFAKAWAHSEHILVDGEKMSKSVGNVYLLSDLTAKGFSPLDYRFYVLSAHYHTRFNFTWDALTAAKTGRRSLLNAYWHDVSSGIPDDALMHRFREALADDLSSPRALSLMFEAASLQPGIRHATLRAMDDVLQILEDQPSIPASVQEILTAYSEARANKQFVQSDAMREQMRELGYVVEDSPTGPRISPL